VKRRTDFARMGRVFMLVLAIGLVPLAIGAVVIQRQSVQDKKETLDRALLSDAASGSSDLTAYFDRARAINVLLAQSPVFRDYYESPGTPQEKTRTRSPAFQRVNAALLYLQRLYPGGLYPGAIGEACFIDRAGFENARVVQGPWGVVKAAPKDLSPDESGNPFFRPTFALAFGEVYQARPYVSPDTHDWVISNSTLMPTGDGSKRAIIHFEITVESVRQILAREAGHHLSIVDRRTGAIIVDSNLPQKQHAPLGRGRDPRFSSLAGIISQQSAVTLDGTRAAYVRVPHEPSNANDWIVVASSPAVQSSLLGINRATLALLALLLVLVALPIAYRWGRLNKDLTEREHDLDQSERRYRILFEEAEAGRRLLAEQNDRLRNLDRMKDDFVASVSHELRTPLTSINGYVELLIEGEAGELNEEQTSFLGVIRRNGERLLRVVGDLLFAAELDARRVDLERAPVDLAALIADARDTARPHAEERQIELVLEAEPVSMVEGDPGRLGQVVDNLLSNALKFTPPGGCVTLRLFGTGEGVHVEISDTGMGISQEDQTQLFERFFRTEQATSAAIQGTGLGLSIVAAIVEAHGGSIDVESQVGFGTTFRIVLPGALVRTEAA
jgi:signal transduction histidine kinase